MLFVVSEAEPAELILALAAGHVHAALVLLNWALALWAWLCIELDPITRVILITINLVFPLLQQVTADRHMGLLDTAEAEGVTTVALNVDGEGLLLLDYLVAVSAWAPLPFLGGVHEGVDLVQLVPDVFLAGEELFEDSGWDDVVAFDVWAFGKDAVWAIG